MSTDANVIAFGRYRVVRALGEGAMGTVYVAEDATLGREVAIKAVRSLGFDAKERFLNEARAVAQLVHPNVVQVFDVGNDGDTPFLVMEIARGGSLRARLERDRTLPPAAVRALGIQIAYGLGAAHARGIVHRDVKPANVLEGDPGVWKLADFGVAHVPDAKLTITGQFLGSPAYAAPEALVAGVFGAASDIYSLACTLYEAAIGVGPYDHCALEVRLRADEAELPIHTSALASIGDPHLAGAIRAGLARDPMKRPSASELARLLSGLTVVKRRRWLVPAVIACVLALLIIGLLSSRDRTGETTAIPGIAPADPDPNAPRDEDEPPRPDDDDRGPPGPPGPPPRHGKPHGKKH